MPIYEYKCGKCDHVFELRRNIADKDDTLKCPKCRAEKPKRQLSMFGTAGSAGSCAPSPGLTGGG